MAGAWSERTRKIVGAWLMIGVMMVFVQIIIGGITRLTGSGLSITKWEIVTGTIPPTSEAGWEEAFDLYKATPQYEMINKGMSMSEFRFIYFWEYFHRFWARLMGIVFAVPFFYFLYKSWLPRKLIVRLVGVIILASIVASFGWIMVASGLVDKPWVSPYKLTMHLSLALLLFSYLIWLTLSVYRKEGHYLEKSKGIGAFAVVVLGMLIVQILLGGMMSGMKAGLNYPTWPTMNGEWVPSALTQVSWSISDFFTNEVSMFAVTFVQFFHRIVAYLLTIAILAFFIRSYAQISDGALKKGFLAMLGFLILQVVLGIATVVNCKGNIPVDLGTYHQAGAVLLLGSLVFILFHLVNNRGPKTA